MIWAGLSLCVAITFFVFAYPMYVIRPFRAQGETELALALLIKHWAPLVGVSAALLGIVCASLLWMGTSRTWSRVSCAAASVMAVLFAVLTNVNVYERMFHRIDVPEVMPGSEAKLADDDMVLAIHVDGHARAYPVRMMGYHHIVNDWVASRPIVATY
jgi:hypothetical protein